MIDARTQLVGLLGWPIEHSLSPAMHNAAFDALGLNWRYVPLPVHPGDVQAAVAGLAALGFRGTNVTVPHKLDALRATDWADLGAQELGAANTLLFDRVENEDLTIRGYNTDVPGFIEALRTAGYEPRYGGRTVVAGAGGAARAAVYALLSEGSGEIDVLNRTLSRAQSLVREVGSRNDWRARLRALPLTTESLVETSRRASLLVNTTTVGMWPRVDASIWPDDAPMPSGLAVFDIVYNPLETRLLQQARASGARVIDGLEMLVQQGALAFDLWTHHRYDLHRIAALMRDACRQVVQA